MQRGCSAFQSTQAPRLHTPRLLRWAAGGCPDCSASSRLLSFHDDAACRHAALSLSAEGQPEVMPTVELTETEVVVHLNYAEKLLAVQATDVRILLTNITTVTVSRSPWTDAKWKGVPVGYALGTGLPFLITFGRCVHLEGVDFVAVKRNIPPAPQHPALCLALKPGCVFRHVVVTVADAVLLAERIGVAMAAAAAAAEEARAAREAAEAEAAAREAEEAARRREEEAGGAGAL